MTHDIDEAIKMGDLVAVLQVGGRLAQFGTPDEILADPASDFVARFVGADRGLKRLALVRVGELELRTATTARPGDDVGCPSPRRRRSFPYLLLSTTGRAHRLDRRSHAPDLDALRAEDAIAESPFFDRQRRSRTPSRCSWRPASRPGIVVDEKDAARASHVEMVMERVRSR